ncbi:hypothetical protein CC117_28995 [Parafrankia colletiae]|uniref:LytR/CpsA/Psr regulator C-terminal domain-containing protein n=1 Tax=Parafrankia colletiae TaxID=573497 RepID=A0A1S1Q922_9ACTN|nr:LytR C-terminal domain-containing protein [Parafrankia colletiae]MCK9903630.1 LytR C-terminal domain-containing protein [Frankia sp. Cpl3]OHV29602.1 hypothetical protein CC117_28995 [Parafrankia colletiae]
MSSLSDEPSPGARNRSTRAVAATMVLVAALLAGALVAALVPDRAQDGVLSPVRTEELLARSTGVPSPRSPAPPGAPATTPAGTTPTATATPTPIPTPTPTASATTAPTGRPAVTIFNNSKEENLAERAKVVLQRLQYVVGAVGNINAVPGGARGSLRLAKTTIFYEGEHEAAAVELAAALGQYDGEEVETRPNDGSRVSPNGTLVLVLTKSFSPGS